jgi:choline kinase
MAGKSKRFYDSGYNTPKSLIEIAGEQILSHILKNFYFISDVLIIVSFDDLKRYSLEKLDYLSDIRIKVVGIESHTKGPSYSIFMAKSYIKQDLPILVHYCDVFANWNVGETFSTLQLSDAIFLSFKGFHPSRMNGTLYAYARLQPGQNRKIQDILEKNSFTEEFDKEDASTGIYGFKSGRLLLQAIEIQLKEANQINGEFYTSLTLGSLVRNGFEVLVQEVGVFHAWGTPTDLQDFIYYSTCLESLATTSPKWAALVNHNAVILAAGKSLRLKIKNGQPKQLKQITNDLKLMDYARYLVSDVSLVYLVARNEVYPVNYWKLDEKNLKLLSHGTESQLDSVMIAQSIISTSNKPVTFLASDNIVLFDKVFNLDKLANECDVLVWTSQNYPFAKKDPDKYSWVRINDDGGVEKSIRKSRPPNFNEWRLVIGNFTFRTNEILSTLIDDVSNNFENDNFELMLDDLIPVAKKLNFEVKIIEVPQFITLGTKSEENIFNYYQSLP